MSRGGHEGEERIEKKKGKYSRVVLKGKFIVATCRPESELGSLGTL